MPTYLIVLIILLGIIALFFLTCYVCFFITFYAPNSKKFHNENAMPPGKIYEPFYDQIRLWKKENKTFKQEAVQITSFDGLKLRGVFYSLFESAPIEIMFHGYRGSAGRDLCGGLQRCQRLGRNVLMVDQRAHSSSEGKVITFGIKERYDVKSWAEYAYKRFGENTKLIITGISMGASTVLMASSLDLPKTVVGVVADCGYSSPKEIIKTVIKKMHLPAWLFYPFVKLGGLIFGRFNIEETSPEQELNQSKLPVLLIHGDTDDFVPCEMSRVNEKACSTVCALHVFKGAGHGASYLIDPDRYVTVLKEFEKHYK